MQTERIREVSTGLKFASKGSSWRAQGLEESSDKQGLSNTTNGIGKGSPVWHR